MYNKIVLIGYLTRDVELKTTAGGYMVGSVGLATNRKWKTDSGEMKEKTMFHNLVIWGKSAQTLAQYVHKGSKLFVEGELDYDTFEDKQGVKKTYAKIIVGVYKFLDSRQDNAQPNKSAEPQRAEASREDDIPVEDLPF